MIDERFFPRKKDSLTLQELVELSKADSNYLRPDLDMNGTINNVGAVEDADEHTLTFFNAKKFLPALQKSSVKICLTDKKNVADVPHNIQPLVVPDPMIASVPIIEAMFDINRQVSKNLRQVEHYFMGEDSTVGEGSVILPNVVIGDNVTIGKNCYIGAGTVIEAGCQIGDGCQIGNNVNILYTVMGAGVIVHSGACLGQDGYGFLPDMTTGRIVKIPQVSKVVIGNMVEIGSCTCIDRGHLSDTMVGDLTKLDNLIHVGHGTKIGQACFVTACVCMAGSSTIGNLVQVGGNSSITGHIHIGDQARIAGHSGVSKSVETKKAVGGYPAQELNAWRRGVAVNHRIVRKYLLQRQQYNEENDDRD